jgi:hypothetical protein
MFWDATIREVLLSIKAMRIRETVQWQMTRFSSYIVYCSVTDKDKRETMYQFLKLDGDPSPEEIEKLQNQQQEEEVSEKVRIYEQTTEYYKQVGAI